MLNLKGLFKCRRVVVLLKSDGDIVRLKESKRINPFTGTKYCIYYKYTNEGIVNLLPDGEVKTSIRSIIAWKYE